MLYERDRAWSDRYIPAIKQIVGPRLLSIASQEMDVQNATDLTVLLVQNKQIAARVRREGKYVARYGDEVTIRTQRETGAATELEKILAGFGHWLFYGFGRPDNSIGRWHIIDLDMLRRIHARNGHIFEAGNKFGYVTHHANCDHPRTHFLALHLNPGNGKHWPRGFVVDQGGAEAPAECAACPIWT